MTLKRRFTGLALAAVLLLVAQPLFAQTTLNSTTTTAALTATQQIIPLTSVTNIAAKDFLFLDRELAQVQSCDSTALNCTVTRGRQSTRGRAHASGVVVYTGVASRFYLDDVVGTCTATAEEFLPHINITNGNIYQCSSSEWVLYRYGGFREFEFGRSDGGTTYTALGAITIQPGLTYLNGTTLAMTLANPSTEQNGLIMMIVATNASAHTVTYTAGFGGGTTSRDVATFAGNVNDNMVIIAFNGVWWVLSTRNVTLG